MREVYRICHQKYAADLSGKGAGLFGGRWNPVGMPMLYTAGSIALACLEYLAHNMHLFQGGDLSLITLEIPEDIVQLALSDLPDQWPASDSDHRVSQQMGANFLQQNECLALEVPSAIVPQETNVLINPMHPEASEIKITNRIAPFVLDERLYR
ncbi:RES family NAD+ phosphorylase [Marinoscillum furvescens]|uniref:RES domain-containing protein n=1 Tax=Marinoscillum furvescens DSM 4134 TaxID=1122208 RepID=A0A3D9L903_MARFU|nr:RES family NAD+ phosphorylase [Marinoscillum furvescens]REE01756.1 RES domain-containing protein [Marinoscillum furvescens DSM 4134]